jgi:hypothetical protein
LGVAGVDLDTKIMAFGERGRYERPAGAAKRVKNGIAGPRKGLDKRLENADGLLSRMHPVACVSQGRTSSSGRTGFGGGALRKNIGLLVTCLQKARAGRVR